MFYIVQITVYYSFCHLVILFFLPVMESRMKSNVLWAFMCKNVASRNQGKVFVVEVLDRIFIVALLMLENIFFVSV